MKSTFKTSLAMREAFRDNEDIAKQKAFRNERNDMNATQAINEDVQADVIKAAARRMCEQLDAKGVRVKHSLMLEALAAGLGVDNWRKLKAIIDAPRKAAAPAVPQKPQPVELTGEWLTWSVDALYFDNHQQYGDSSQGRTPLEAAIGVIVERLTDFGLEVGILTVTDGNGVVQLSPDMLDSIRLESNCSAFRRLRNAAQAVQEAGGLDSDKQSYLKWLNYLVEAYGEPGLSDLTDWNSLEKASLDAEHGYIEGQSETPCAVLQALCEVVESHAGGVVKLEKANEELASALYHVRAICDYFGQILNDPAFEFADIDPEELEDY